MKQCIRCGQMREDEEVSDPPFSTHWRGPYSIGPLCIDEKGCDMLCGGFIRIKTAGGDGDLYLRASLIYAVEDIPQGSIQRLEGPKTFVTYGDSMDRAKQIRTASTVTEVMLAVTQVEQNLRGSILGPRPVYRETGSAVRREGPCLSE